jgi:hypothetical protein
MFTFGCSDGVDIQILFPLFGKDIVVVLFASASLKSTDSNPFSKLLVSFPVNVVAIVFVVSFGKEIEDCYKRKENESEETIINTGKHLILNDHTQQTTFSEKLSSPREDMSEQQTTKTIATTLTGNETNSFENGLESVDFNEADANNTTTISFPNIGNSICISTPSEHPKVKMASTLLSI